MQTRSFISWFKDDLLPKDRILNCLAWWIRLFKNWLLHSPISGFTSQRPQRAYNGCLITFSSTPLCLCNFGEVPGCGYLTTPRTPQTAILVLSTSPWGSDLVQGKKGAGERNAFSFLIRSPTYSSSVNIPSVTAREALICIPQKMVPRRESQGKVVNWKKA